MTDLDVIARQLLVQSHFGRVEEAPATALSSLDAQNWENLIAALEYHGITPLIAPLFEDGRIASIAGRQTRRMIRALRVKHRLSVRRREACVDELLTAFADADIAILLLKGAALAHQIYQAPELRPSIDIDVLIKATDNARARMCCEKLGYRFSRQHRSPYARWMHHLPVAEKELDEATIQLEIHTDVMSPSRLRRLGMSSLCETPRAVERSTGPRGLTLGHVDMLRHLTCHAFEPARNVRLIHLFDTWLYARRYGDEIDWKKLQKMAPEAAVAADMASRAFQDGGAIAGIGKGMPPLSELISSSSSLGDRMSALFCPPEWWLRGFYGVAAGKSLKFCLSFRHPLTVLGWVLLRSAARTVNSVTPAMP
ncbi:MAG: nucleotidyltransferase family protein [Xanthobacteraceae bacterium]